MEDVMGKSQDKVYNREEWEMPLRMIRNRNILEMTVG
jgi:hypothetical protein